MRRLALVLALVVVAGCGGSDEPEPPAAEPQPPPASVPAETEDGEETEPGETTGLVVYLLRDGRVQPVRRSAPETQAVARAALEALFAGPTARERGLGLTSEVPAGTRIERLAVAGGVASVDLAPCPPLAQLVFTLTRFSTVETVTGSCTEGRRLTRAAFENETPAILVETPLLDEAVESPLELAGSANTFEATFQVELIDAGGGEAAKTFVTATSGSGTRGTFEESVPFEADGARVTLRVYEVSAKDGSRINEIEIPLRLR